MKRIGIDFDNTIAIYSDVFRKVALKNKLIAKNGFGTKAELRKKIIFEKNVEVWKKLQGQVYGAYMHNASPSKYLNEFILKAQILESKIFIVSHKTEFGHYDEKKIKLRDEAIRWIKKKGYLKNIKIFFENSIPEKIERINSLKLDYFIDDLEIILNHKLISKKTKKILFCENINNSVSKKGYNWLQIKDLIFDNNNKTNLKKYIEFITNKKVDKINQLKGRKNSKIFKIRLNEKKIVIVKQYPERNLNDRRRIEREIEALKILKKKKITNIPKIFYYNKILNILIMEFINGSTPKIIRSEDLNHTLNFIKKIKKLKKEINNYPYYAVESCENFQKLLNQINYKINNLEEASNRSKTLKHHLNKVLKKTFKNLMSSKKKTEFYKALIKKKNQKKLILSPSDFGFHNSIKFSKKIYFIDFEYFGIDDPVKLVIDFILHPGMSLNAEIKKKWIKENFRIFSDDKNFKKRLNFLIPFFAIRWALIVLNDYKIKNVNEHCKKNNQNKKIFLQERDRQIKKSIYFCYLVNTRKYLEWFN